MLNVPGQACTPHSTTQTSLNNNLKHPQLFEQTVRQSFYSFGLCLANRGVCYIVFANVPRASGNVCLAFRPTVWQVLICRYCVTGSCKLKQLSEVAVYKEHHHLTLFSWEFCKGERRDRQRNEGMESHLHSIKLF